MKLVSRHTLGNCFPLTKKGVIMNRPMYLIVKCKELDDQWECDCDRTPMCLTDDLSSWNSNGADYYYEVYEVQPDGALTLIDGLTL